jgi:hypothetical protein
MLEVRKLSAQVQQQQSGRVWSGLFFFICLLTFALMLSVWIGANFETPAPDESQEKMTEAHANVLVVVARLATLVAPEQEVNPEVFEQLDALSAPLQEFGQLAATGLRLSPETKDPLTWPGKVNLILDDLKVVSDGQASVLSFFRLRDGLLGFYRPKGSLNPQQLSENSAALGFYAALSSIPSSNQLTWGLLTKGQVQWREINTQMDSLELESKQAEDPVRAKLAKELMALLAKNDWMQSIRNADDTWTQVSLAQSRLHLTVGQVPAEPQVIITSPPWNWSRLAYPGTTSQGLLACACMMLLAFVVAGAEYVARRHQLHLLSEKWLSVTRQLETSVRSVDAPLASAIMRIDALSSEFTPVIDKLKSMQRSMIMLAEAPPKTIEEQAWAAASRMQSELESDLNLLREKLLNIHLQFCSGQTYENLVYDLAFTTEAVQTVSLTAKDLGRSVALLKDSLQQPEDMGDGQEIESLTAQVISLRASAKRIALSLQELSDRLQVAVEDVPKGRRFEAERAGNETGRPSVNQSI